MLIVLDIGSDKMFYVLLHIAEEHDVIRENYGQLKNKISPSHLYAKFR